MCMDIHTDKEIKIQTIMEKFTPLVRANIPCITLLPKGGHYWRQRNAAHTGRNALCQTSFSSFSGMDSGSIKRNTSRVVAWCELIAKTVATSHLTQLKINREEPIRPNKLLWRVPEDWIVSSSPSSDPAVVGEPVGTIVVDSANSLLILSKHTAWDCPCFCAGCCSEYYGVLFSNNILNNIPKNMRERRGT